MHVWKGDFCLDRFGNNEKHAWRCEWRGTSSSPPANWKRKKWKKNRNEPARQAEGSIAAT